MLGGLENPGLSTSEKLVDERLQLPIVDKVRVGTVLSHVMGKLGLAALGKLPPEFPAIVVGLRNGVWREERLGLETCPIDRYSLLSRISMGMNWWRAGGFRSHRGPRVRFESASTH